MIRLRIPQQVITKWRKDGKAFNEFRHIKSGTTYASHKKAKMHGFPDTWSGSLNVAPAAAEEAGQEVQAAPAVPEEAQEEVGPPAVAPQVGEPEEVRQEAGEEEENL